ncbi:MAG: hypothetical protein DMG41_01355 [Acidobacteria bacterium]|nr:MAG: hypothetical protein AUH13_27650 [Acidobacteria bacterium 13_2_20CM_58_27]PYT91780.1 MAG: hypothetical protein DMG41_01355 [Acidobacteriota bacterium]
MNDADHDGEAVHCANAGKVQTDADGEIPGRVEGRECTDFVHVDHGDTSYYALLDNLSYRLDQNGPYNTVLAVFAVKNLPFSSIAPNATYAGAKVLPSGVQPDQRLTEDESRP